MSGPIWLSVIIPTYNGSKYLGEALDSVAMQADGGVEAILIDDGSTDGTIEIAKSFQGKLNLEIIERSHVGNWVTGTNIGIERARGEFLSCLHQDDFWLEGRVETVKRLIYESPNASLFLHPSWFVDGSGRFLGIWRCPFAASPAAILPRDLVPRLLVQNFISMPAPVFRRSLATALGGMDRGLWYTADWDLWLKIAGSGTTVYFPNPLTAFRIHPLSQTIRRGNPEEIRRQLEAVFLRHWERWDGDALDKKRIRRLAEASIELNVMLAGRWSGLFRRMIGFLGVAARLAPSDWREFLRDTRIWERFRCRAQVFALTPIVR